MQQSFNDMPLAKKLTIVLLVIGILPATLIAFISLYQSSSALSEAKSDSLTAISELKAESVKEYYASLDGRLTSLAEGSISVNSLEAFVYSYNRYDKDIGIVDSSGLSDFYQTQFKNEYQKRNDKSLNTQSLYQGLSTTAKSLQTHYIAKNSHPLGSKDKLMSADSGVQYDNVHGEFHPEWKGILESSGYYDIFIVDAKTHNIVYTVFKESDFATNLKSGPYKNSPLADVYNKALKLSANQKSVLEDFSPYVASYDSPASFIAAPIRVNGTTIGVLICQVSIEQLNKVMSSQIGLGETGESYLIGGDYKMRTDSFHHKEDFSVDKAFKTSDKGIIKTEQVKKALNGELGVMEAENYFDENVMVAYRPIDIMGFQWALIVEQKSSEALSAVTQLQWVYLVMAVIMISIISFISIRFGQSIAKPIQELSEFILDFKSRWIFSMRTPVRSQDETGQAAASLNELLSSLDDAVQDITGTMQAMSSGDFEKRVTVNVSGDLDTLKNTINTSSSTLNETVDNIVHVMNGIREGQFDQRITVDAQGKLLKLKEEVNESAGATAAFISDAVNVMQKLESGDYQVRVNAMAAGDLNTLKQAINQNIANTQQVLAEIEQVMQSMQQGQFGKQMQCQAKGQLNTIKESVNSASVTTSDVINAIIPVMQSMAEGDFSRQVDVQTQGDLLRLKQSINQAAQGTNEVVSEIMQVMDQVAKGEFSQRVTVDAKGELDILKQGVNSAAESCKQIVTDISLVMEDLAHGRLGSRVTQQSQGDFKKLSDAVNLSAGTLESVFNRALEVIEAMAVGDLTQSIHEEYEGSFSKLKDGLNTTLSHLVDVIGEINQGSTGVAHASKEISAGNLDLSRRTEQQAASLEETASSMEQMTATIMQNTESSKHASALAIKTQDVAITGGEVVEQAITAMGVISDSSDKIVDIISVIDEIAFQTNLLALNASVEAARAGEQGRGFAVVAGEVRTLAGRSATAAKEIKELIEDSGHKVEEGKKLVNESGQSLKHIVESVNDVSRLVAEIATASEEQSMGIAEINRAVTKMDEMTQQNAALVEEVASTSDTLGVQAGELLTKVSFFRVR
ncbi:MAG: HAMP domain-containing protein [Pseudomonadales bacterium]|nr:HAMP domain-containing protein [Pseudomonadales bacterium]